MNYYETINDVLVNLFNEIMDIEQNALKTSEFKNISVNDMHIIAAIGLHSAKNMTTVAKALSVTVGTLTTAVNSLVKKGYVQRVRSEDDRRVVLISLSETGEKVFLHHKAFHDKMAIGVLNGLNAQEAEVLTKALQNVQEFFHTFK